MSGGVASRLAALAARGARPIDEAGWRRLRRRVVWGLLAVGGLFAVQTAMVQSPDYLVGALYHQRRVLAIEVARLPPDKRAKLLERLCLAEALIVAGGADPYRIEGGERCAAGRP